VKPVAESIEHVELLWLFPADDEPVDSDTYRDTTMVHLKISCFMRYLRRGEYFINSVVYCCCSPIEQLYMSAGL
jgi:hypothetical protein